jgi:hypothetical protein
MTITVERLPNEPIIVATFAEPMRYDAEVPAMFARILELRETIINSPKYYVLIDITAVKPGFNEVMFSLSEVRKASQKRRPDLPISLHLAGEGDLFSLLAKSMSQMQYGSYIAPLHPSADEALKSIRAQIEAGSK